MDSLIFELQIVFYFQLFLSANVRHSKMSAKMYLMSKADVTGQPQGLFPVSGLPYSLLLHNLDGGVCCQPLLKRYLEEHFH